MYIVQKSLIFLCTGARGKFPVLRRDWDLARTVSTDKSVWYLRLYVEKKTKKSSLKKKGCVRTIELEANGMWVIGLLCNYIHIQGVQKKLCFFTIHCNPSLPYIAVKTFKVLNAMRVYSYWIWSFSERPIAAQCWWRGRGVRIPKFFGIN